MLYRSLGRAVNGSDDEPDGGAAAPAGPLGGGVIELSVVGSYEPVVGDIDGDGRDDVVWYAPGPAGDSIWFGTASGRPRSRSFSASGTYVPLVADFDASGSDDLRSEEHTSELPSLMRIQYAVLCLK